MSDIENSKTKETIDSYIKVLENELERTKSDILSLEKCLIDLKDFPFKQGEVVVSKTKGNAILSSVVIKISDYSSFTTSIDPRSIWVEISTAKGIECVPMNDIIPYTIVSKVLYDRN